MTDAVVMWQQLNVESSLVLLCDLQKQIVARSKTTKPDALAKSAGVLLQVARLFSLPTVLSVVPENERPSELIDELGQAADSAEELLRVSANPFRDSGTVAALARTGRKVLIVAGFATEVVVLHAVLDALERGYVVFIAIDASGGMSERTEQVALRHMESAGAITTSVVSLATKLAPDFTTEKGRQMFALIQQLRLGS